MYINTLINNDNFLEDFYKFDVQDTGRPVVVSWNSTGLHTIAGPTPFVDISKSFNTNDAGIVESIVNTINLTGKIIKPNVDGFTNVVSGIKLMQNLFENCSVGSLEIKCNNNIIFNATGVIVKNLSFNKTENNWVKSADYNIDLEYKTIPSGANPIDSSVTDRSDSWTIEPLDDAVYTKFIKIVSQKSEYSNPNMLPRTPAIENPVPAQSLNPGPQASPENSIQIFNIPQYRISRRLSAKSIVTPSGGSGCLSGNNSVSRLLEKRSFLQAKAWVDKESALLFDGNKASGSLYFTDNPTFASLNGNTWLYNHARTTSIDVYNGSYEANDTWIAMPTGIPYIETFNIDASVDNENTKTVRVAGSIQGLVIMPLGNLSNASGTFPLSSGANASSGIKVDLSASLVDPLTGPTNYALPNISGSISKINTIQNSKYLNALSAWTKDIKPYLYRRACLAINSDDRSNPPVYESGKPPPNTIYTTEGLLNVNPISTSEGHDPIKGTISYSHEFNNKLQTISGVLSENIRISNTAPANSVQETQILGRALGPLLFSGGVTNPRKNISVEIVVPKATGIKATFQTDPSCPMYYKGFFWQTVDTLINGHAPFSSTRQLPFFGNPPPTGDQFGTVFKDSDSEDWNPTEGRYSRSVSWIYQHCTTSKFYLDH